MQQTPNLFSENNLSPQKLAANQPAKPFSGFFALPDKDEETPVVTVAGRTNDGSVKYFDLVTQNSFFKADGSEEAAPAKEPVFAETNKNKISFFITARDSSSNVKPFPLAANNSEKLFELLLFHFDQIVYLNEISEKIRELDAALQNEDVVRVNSIARDCAALSNSCGMMTAIAPFECLSQLKTKLQLADAAFLMRRVRKESSRFRFTLKESLKQLIKQVRLDGLAVKP